MSALPKFTCPTPSHPAVKFSGRTDAKTTRNSTRQQQNSHQLPTTQPLAQPTTKAWTTTPNSNPSISHQNEQRTIQPSAILDGLQSHDQPERHKHQHAVVRDALHNFTEALLCRRPDDAFHEFEQHKRDLFGTCEAQCPAATWDSIRVSLEAQVAQVRDIVEANFAMFENIRTKQRRGIVHVKASQMLQIHQRQLQTAQLEQENERLIQNRRMAAKHASKLKTRKQHQEALLVQIQANPHHQADQVKVIERTAVAASGKDLFKLRPPWWVDDDASACASRRNDYDVDSRTAKFAMPAERFGRKGAPWFDE
ncbi:hypothetical protein, variant 1 [Aphanomyces astaci]|uniref:Uncharacterized protein n=1 Tax=Aphanomyces astaci TaxID=112090 RepID=W4FSV4_APHAT|nr:hypothetical protein, variant 1 [Aphanomyces astaci]ETV69934.1 hypothetical protein, variant 1 [Aphanomyces astaci]|eukprot:XP_009840671.1 hypothetical protein, variant 1 [Aphanomyces astaci]